MLSDAEYRELSETQKTDYWRVRFYNIEQERDDLKEEVRYKDGIIRKAADTLGKALQQ
jgi:hypothetical protein